MTDLKKTEMELCIDRYSLKKKVIQDNYDHYKRLYVDLFNSLKKNLSAESLNEVYVTNILMAVLDGEDVMLKFLRAQKPLPPPTDLEIIIQSVAHLIWLTFNSKNGDV